MTTIAPNVRQSPFSTPIHTPNGCAAGRHFGLSDRYGDVLRKAARVRAA